MGTEIVDAAFYAGQNKDGVQYAGRALARGDGAGWVDQRLQPAASEPSGIYLQRLSEALTAILQRGNPFLLVGGDHSVGLSSVVAVRRVHPTAKVLWVDAHADVHTWHSSLTKNLHGMPLGIARHGGAGHPTDDFAWVPAGTLPATDLGYVGLRDVDDPEWEAIDNCLVLDAAACRGRTGIDLAQTVLAWVGAAPLHLSIDVDVLDPSAFTATGYSIPDGLHLDQLTTLLATLRQHAQVVSADLVEYNPTLDVDGSDASTCKQLLHLLADPVASISNR